MQQPRSLAASRATGSSLSASAMLRTCCRRRKRSGSVPRRASVKSVWSSSMVMRRSSLLTTSHGGLCAWRCDSRRSPRRWDVSVKIVDRKVSPHEGGMAALSGRFRFESGAFRVGGECDRGSLRSEVGEGLPVINTVALTRSLRLRKPKRRYSQPPHTGHPIAGRGPPWQGRSVRSHLPRPRRRRQPSPSGRRRPRAASRATSQAGGVES